MNQTCLVLPLLPGKATAAEAWLRELAGRRKAEYDRSARRLGVVKAVWYLGGLPPDGVIVAYLESIDAGRAVTRLAQSQDAFDLWLKRQLLETTGAAPSHLPATAVAEPLFRYDSSPSWAALEALVRG